MSKIAVVYWSGTGNTEAMANAVLEGARSAGNDAAIFTADQFSGAQAAEYDAIAFGCPAMGADLVSEGVIANDAPGGEEIAACKALGAAL